MRKAFLAAIILFFAISGRAETTSPDSRGQVPAQAAVSAERDNPGGTDDPLELSRKLSAIQRKYEDLKLRSENVTATIEERDKLSQEKEELSQEAEDLRVRLKSAENSSNIKWFLAGALIFMAGWFLGAAGGRNKRGNPYY